MVLLSYELPSRLRGLWPWWARFLVSAILGFFTGWIVWTIFTLYFLYFEPDTWQNYALAGLGTAVAFAISATFPMRIARW
jgi:hypothetical protein